MNETPAMLRTELDKTIIRTAGDSPFCPASFSYVLELGGGCSIDVSSTVDADSPSKYGDANPTRLQVTTCPNPRAICIPNLRVLC